MNIKYPPILTTIVLTIGLNLLMKPAQAQEPTFNDVFQQGLSTGLNQTMNATPPPPVDGVPDDRTGAGTRAIQLLVVQPED